MPELLSTRVHGLALAAGLLLALVMAWLAYRAAAGKRRAEARIASMEADLGRLAVVAKRTSNAVVITDLDRRITWANEGFERLIGRAAADVLGQPVKAVLHWVDDDASKLSAMNRALQDLQPFHGELLMQVPNGDPCWLELEIQPIAGPNGIVQGFMALASDTTAKKRAEAALVDSQTFLDRTGRISGVGGWQVDLASRQLQWTDETCRIHDMPPGHRPGLKGALHFGTAAGRRSLLDAVRHSLRSGQGLDLELPLRTAKGRAVWVRVVGEVESRHGQPVRMVGAMQDITARRQLEDELRQRHQVMASILDNLPCGLSVFNAELQLVASNRQFRELLGFPERLFSQARPPLALFVQHNADRGDYGPGDAAQLAQQAMARLHDPQSPGRYSLLGRAQALVEAQGVPMPGGGFVATYTDTSERHRAEQAIERSNLLLRSAIDTVDEAFVLYDPEDRLVFCNDKYKQIYAKAADLIVPGAKFEDIIRKGAERGDYVEAQGRVDEWVAERLAAHRQANTTLVQPLAGGRMLRIVERRLPDGHTVGFRIDITELTRAAEAAQESSRAKSQFLANTSHELRTPMNAVLGMLALLRKTELSHRQADYATKAEGAARSLLGVLNDILDFSKVEAGKLVLESRPLRIERLVNDLGAMLSANVGTKPVELLFDIDPAVPKLLLGDGMRLQQVLVNLAGNAVKFTRAGEVVVSVALRARQGQQATLEFEVRDTGIGIAPEHQSRIFEGFHQAEASTTRRYGGTGLGLAISRHLVHLMGGNLQLSSTLGQGTRFGFCISLPVIEQACEPAATAERAATDTLPEPQQPPWVLIVDDHPTARVLLQRMAESLGWWVTIVSSANEAMAHLEHRPDTDHTRPRWPEALFVDFGLPGQDGLDALQQLREATPSRQMACVLMVTMAQQEALAKHSEAGAESFCAHLLKPVTASLMAAALAEAQAGPAPRSTRVPPVASAAQRLAGLRLLLAEDSIHNQQVARELLEDEGASVHIAHHGQEAVDAIAAAPTPFDLVLMDLQMPVMDGLTATGLIRHSLGREGLPIVAMTANAMTSDREVCLAAGMNDHVGKPFDLDSLVEVINRWTGRDPSTGRSLWPEMPTLSAPVQAAAAEAGIDLPAALARMAGRVDVYRRMLRNFVRDLAQLPDRLHDSASTQDGPALQRAAHGLKGLAATLGVSRLAQAAAHIEQRLAPPCTPDSDLLAEAERLAEAALATRQSLSRLLAELTEPEPAAQPVDIPDAPALRQTLGELMALLRDSDMRATTVMATIQQQHGPALGARISALDEAVSTLDFDAAEGHCKQLLDSMAA